MVSRLGLMVDRSNSERLRGFCDRQTDRQMDIRTDICDCRVAFATEKTHENVSLRRTDSV